MRFQLMFMKLTGAIVHLLKTKMMSSIQRSQKRSARPSAAITALATCRHSSQRRFSHCSMRHSVVD